MAIYNRGMKPTIARPIAVILSALLLASAPESWATCGGGGGGGRGGMSPSGGGAMPPEQTYPVPWKLIQPQDPAPSTALQMYWFPSSQTELEKSSLLYSRTLSLYASQCVTMGIVDARTPIGQKFAAGDKLPVAVLAQPDGTLVAKAVNKDGYLRVDQVEKLLDSEMKRRQDALKEKMESAKSKAKDAAKALKKLGVTDVGQLFDAPVFDPVQSAKIERTMRDGLKAENDARYTDAERLYTKARRMDPADPMSRAVAQHGLGKMTIHDGEFKKGLALMEASVQTYPLALAYRNLSVYWNSEGDTAKADYYVHQALALDPTDSYNLVFAAAFMAGNGHGDEALKIAQENEALLPASYNLAAVYAQAGQREKALALLQRHFFQYERYQAVRTKEMMEARVDAVFASLRDDPTFLSLTSGADGKLDPSKAMDAHPGAAN